MNTDDRLNKNNQYYDRFFKEVGNRSEIRDFSKAFSLFLPLV